MAEIYLKQRRTLAGSIYLLSALWGFHSVLDASHASNDVLIPFVIAASVTMFCLVDAKIHHKPIPVLAGWLIFASWPVSAPISLFWIHGKKKALRVVVFLFSVVAVCFAGAFAAFLIVR
jgi:hypothetical protein